MSAENISDFILIANYLNEDQINASLGKMYWITAPLAECTVDIGFGLK